MNKNLKIGLIVLGVVAVGVGGYLWYKKWRMTSGNAQKDLRKINIIRTSATAEQELVDAGEDEL